jgi:hypothetical protein
MFMWLIRCVLSASSGLTYERIVVGPDTILVTNEPPHLKEKEDNEVSATTAAMTAVTTTIASIITSTVRLS